MESTTRDPASYINPCPAPHLPPIAIELADIQIAANAFQYKFARQAVRGYWQQATNMSLEDQLEYKDLIEKCKFTVPFSARRTPNRHIVYRECETDASWAKYVFLKALYDPIPLVSLEELVLPRVKSLRFQDLTEDYRRYHPDPRAPRAGGRPAASTPSNVVNTMLRARAGQTAAAEQKEDLDGSFQDLKKYFDDKFQALQRHLDGLEAKVDKLDGAVQNLGGNVL